jgi:hypothetical protein
VVPNLTGWVDYDRPQLPSLNAAERIDYFEKRVRLVVINPLERIVSNEIHVAPDSSALLIFGVAICCAVEASGKFLKGSKGNKAQIFDAFLTAYMAGEYRSGKVGRLTYGEALWRHFRNGLAHGFTVCHGGFEGNRGQPYFSVRPIAGTPSLMVNPYLLFDDFAAGFGRYLSDLRAGGPADRLFRDFDTVFNAVFIQGG